MTGRTGPNKTSTGESPAAVLLPAPLYKTDPLLPCRRATSPATRHTERGPSSDLHGACHAPGRAEVVPGRGPGARLCKGGPRHGDWTRGDGSTRHACSVQGSRTREYTEEGGDVWRAPAGGGGRRGRGFESYASAAEFGLESGRISLVLRCWGSMARQMMAQ